MTTISIYEPIQEELLIVEEKLKKIGSVNFSPLAGLLNHVLSGSGKRTRPAITLLSSKFHPSDGEFPILLAVAVELLHLATLIHDDTVDMSSLRRGKPTVNSVWGGNVAVLLGDYVFATSAAFVCDTKNMRVIRLFSETLMALSSGELRERFTAFDWRQTMDNYWDRIRDKTASLFTTASEGGAILSGAPEDVVQALRSYGYNLGMAFQIVDDILDFQGTQEEMGKPVGSDLLQGTLTLPAIFLLERYPRDNPVKKVFQNQSKKANLKRALDMINNSNIIELSYTVAADFCEKARKALDALPDNRYKRSLLELVDFVLERRR